MDSEIIQIIRNIFVDFLNRFRNAGGVSSHYRPLLGPGTIVVLGPNQPPTVTQALVKRFLRKFQIRTIHLLCPSQAAGLQRSVT